jgi:predicted CXXCH cytochrome family protein
MKALRSFRAGVLTVLVAVLGVAATAVVASADDQSLPAYLTTATYITSAKCKMCHRAVYDRWADTQHAKNVTAGPWGTPPEGGATPPADLIFRYVTGYNSADGTYAEKGTACEACHGPGSTHFHASMDERKSVIVSPDALATPGQKYSVCGRCHGQYTVGGKRFADGFLPGMDLFKMDGFKLDPIVPGKTLEQLNEIVTSKHFQQGIVCTTCHAVHGENVQEHQLRQPIVELCLGCHSDKTKVHDAQDVIPSLAAHQPNAPAGDTCATCHMPNGEHIFAIPAK